MLREPSIPRNSVFRKFGLACFQRGIFPLTLSSLPPAYFFQLGPRPSNAPTALTPLCGRPHSLFRFLGPLQIDPPLGERLELWDYRILCLMYCEQLIGSIFTNKQELIYRDSFVLVFRLFSAKNKRNTEPITQATDHSKTKILSAFCVSCVSKN